jgi:hypothetical protein
MTERCTQVNTFLLVGWLLSGFSGLAGSVLRLAGLPGAFVRRASRFRPNRKSSSANEECKSAAPVRLCDVWMIVVRLLLAAKSGACEMRCLPSKLLL